MRQTGRTRWRRPAGGLLLVLAAGVAEGRPQPPPGEAGAPWFEEVSAAAGLARPHHTRSFKNPYAEIMAGYTALGAAAAVADFDGDGWEDLFVTDSAEGAPNHLYRNLFGETGRLAFADVAAAAGVAAGNDAANASSDALFFDYDNDGRPDLFVARFGRSQLFHNLGGGRFREMTRQAGLDRYANAITAIAFDADRDGRLDLLVGGYFQPIDVFQPQTPRFFPESFETAANGGGVVLWRNQGDGTFRDVTATAGLAQSGWTLDLGHGDADGDGDDDLYVACDFGTDRFFLNVGAPGGAPAFRDVTAAAIGIDTKKGMNAEWGDYDEDGRLDVYVTNITDDYMREGNFLWRNDGPNAAGEPTFTDVARETGTYDTGWGWGGKFFDPDNDGWLDLYVVDGWVSAGPQSYVPDIFAMITRGGVDFADARNWPPMGGKSLSGYEKNRFFHNRGGIFHEEGARHGLDSTRDGRGIAVADFDQDGREDLFVANANALPALYHDRAPAAGHWAAFRLEGRRSSRDGVGARLLLTAGGRRLLRFVDGGNGFAGQSSRRVHFGLASAAAVERLEVVWPSGVRQTFSGFAADRMYRVVEGEPELRLFTPASAGPAAAAPPSNPYEQARALVAAGQAEAALPHFEAALAADPDSLRYASDYRQAVIRAGAYDRALDVFAQLVEKHPRSHNAWLNYGYAYVDKIPAAGSISQLILANQALDKFSKAIEIERSWLALYTRGNAYLYWPAVFGCAPLAVADLEEAVAISKGEPKRSVHVHAYVALGDGYWKTDQPEKARATWREAAGLFPGDPRLQARLARDGEELSAYIYDQLDPNQRVDTDLSPLWQE